jgi:glycosyltransferase involved in cell wall biosynthesis
MYWPSDRWTERHARRPMISVVILTHNEAINIERCLASVAWADDILVIDSGSTDGTQVLATRRGARVMHRPFDHFAGQRNFALDHGQLRHPWVLHLDADEEVSDALRQEMLRIAADGQARPAYRVPSRLMLLGQWLRHSGMYPAYQVRFGRLGRLRFHMVGHGQRETLPPEELGTMTGHLVHHNFSKGISDWMTKHARYARDEARAAADMHGRYHWHQLLSTRDPVERRRILKALSHALPFRPVLRFLYVYLGRLGLLDGRAGLRYALLMATYQWMIDINVIELELKKV